MNEVVKSKWIEALESGEYAQDRQYLKTNKGYCCLGVLCELYRQEHPEQAKWEPSSWNNSFSFVTSGPQEGAYLVKEVMDWAGFEVNNPEINGTTLSGWNDEGKEFLEIAKLIRENL